VVLFQFISRGLLNSNNNKRSRTSSADTRSAFMETSSIATTTVRIIITTSIRITRLPMLAGAVAASSLAAAEER